jgi:hypothetical protein
MKSTIFQAPAGGDDCDDGSPVVDGGLTAVVEDELEAGGLSKILREASLSHFVAEVGNLCFVGEHSSGSSGSFSRFITI